MCCQSGTALTQNGLVGYGWSFGSFPAVRLGAAGKLGRSGEREGLLLPGRRNALSIRKNAMPRQLIRPAPSSSEFPVHQVKSRAAGSDPSYSFNWSSVTLAAIVASAAITLYMMFIPRGLGIEEMDIGIT